MKKLIYASIALIAISLIILTENVKIQKNEINDIKINEQQLFNEDNSKLLFLYFEILDNDIKYPDIVFAQALLESGYMTSYIFTENKNLFGMRYPERRETKAIDENRGYSRYNCWTDSVKDYKLFQDFLLRKKEKSREEYFSFLSRIYAEDSNYVFFVKKIINENESIINKNYDSYKKYKKSIDIYEYNEKLCEIIKLKRIV
jgi:hypothetical protein